nr:hypothetical protein [uncultured Acetatifactor sp.]
MKKENTASRLNKIMAERNLRQVDILECVKPFCIKYDIKMNKSDLSQYVSGKVEPSQEKLVVLGMALNVSEAWLMGFDVPMERTASIKESSPKIMQYYELLNDIGKYEATKQVKLLTEVPRYLKNNDSKNDGQTNVEISKDLNPHFTNVNEAREYLRSQKFLAALSKNMNNFPDSDALVMANTLYRNNHKEQSS